MAESSSKRARLDSVAAGGESNSWPSVSAGRQQCHYTGCVRPLLTSELERKFCGDMHRNLHMSNLAMTRSCRGQEIVTSSSGTVGVADYAVSDSNKPKCMLPGCGKKALWDYSTGQYFDFCGVKHKLTMVEDMTKVWSREGRLCQVDECYRHVFVKEDGTLYDYCGMKHATFAAARKGATTSAIEKRRSIVDPREMLCTTSSQEHDSEKECLVESLVDSEVGYHERISDSELLRLLKGGANEERLRSSVQHGINIYDFHPWELVNKFGGCRPRYFIHSVTQQREQKGQLQSRRKTKDGFSWKQSGPLHSSDSKDMETRYLKYVLEKPNVSGHLPHVQEYRKFNEEKLNEAGTEKSEKRKGPKCRWKLHEISLRECRENCAKTVWMIFQDEQGKPVWPPCRQPFVEVPDGIDVPDVILKPSQVEDFQTHDDVGRNDPQFDCMQLDFCNTDGWGTLIEDLCDTQIDPSSGIVEDSHSQLATGCLWKH